MKKSMLIALAASFAAATARGVALDASKYSCSFTVTFGGYSGTETLVDFPVLVRVSRALNGFCYDYCKVEGGGDLRFADVNGELLPSEVERWNPDGESLVWVKVPALSNGTSITAYYGCATPDAVDPTQVWDDNFLAVWHLGAGRGEMGGNAASQYDSTKNGKTFTLTESSYPDGVNADTNGVAGLGVAFGLRSDDHGAYWQRDTEEYFGGFTTFTSEAWTYQDDHNPEDTSRKGYVLRKAASEDTVWAVFENPSPGAGKMALNAWRIPPFSSGTSAEVVVSPANDEVKPQRATWNYSVQSFDGSADSANRFRAVYLNGTQQEGAWTTPDMEFTVTNTALQLCLGNQASNGNRPYKGIIDEVRLSKVARSADWVKATYDSIRPDSGFATYSVDWTRYTHGFAIRFPGAPEGTLANFPVLVRLSRELNGFQYCECKVPGGGDLRFSDSGGNLLQSEVERWDASGESLVWVKVPELTSGTVITAHYGCATPEAVDPTQVWDDDFLAVWHLGAGNKDESGRDSTANHKDFEIVGHSAGLDASVNGIAGMAVAFGQIASGSNKGKGCYSQTDGDGYFGGHGRFTAEAWAYQDDHAPASAPSTAYMLNKTDVMSLRELKNDGRVALNVQRDGDTAIDVLPKTSETKPQRAVWNYFANAYDGDSGEESFRAVYLNGVGLEGSWSNLHLAFSVTNNANRLALGSRYWDSAESFPGIIDEVRLSKVARSAAWVKATHDTIRPDSGFAVYEVPNDWNMYRRRFSVTFSGAPEGTLEDFPALVRISENSPAGFRYADCQKPDGGDLRFADSGGVLLPSEVERWNPEGESLVWVKVPQLTSSTELTAYYGNAFAPEVDSTEVWDSHYIAVWHLGANDTTQPDSTSNHRDFTNIYNQSSVAIGTNGMAGLAVAFNKNGKSDGSFWQEDKEGYFGGRTVFTSEAWTYQDAHAADADASNDYVFRKANVVAMSGDDKGRMKLAVYRIGATALNIVSTNDASIAPKPARAAWNYSVHTLDGREGIGSRAVYLNGEQLARGWGSDYLEFSVTNTASMLCLGNYSTNSNSRAFPGIVDEVRLSDVVRPAAWVKATYDTMRTGSGFAEYSKVKRNAAYVSITIK